MVKTVTKILILGALTLFTFNVKCQVDGLYYSRNKHYLYFNQDSFIYFIKNSTGFHNTESGTFIGFFNYPDTISYGTWHYEKKHNVLVLNSTRDTYGYYVLNGNSDFPPVEYSVVERFDSTVSDSVFVTLNSSLTENDYQWSVIPLVDDGDFEERLTTKNEISFKREELMDAELGLDAFGANIYPNISNGTWTGRYDGSFPYSSVYTYQFFLLYFVNNPKANRFDLTIPNLNYQFIKEKVLIEDYALYDNGVIHWEGMIFKPSETEVIFKELGGGRLFIKNK